MLRHADKSQPSPGHTSSHSEATRNTYACMGSNAYIEDEASAKEILIPATQGVQLRGRNVL